MSKDVGYKALGEAEEITAAPRVIEALISSATDLRAAVADLVDNSIDAKATHVQVRIHTPASADLATGTLALSVWDNGTGMNAETLEEAVTLSHGEDSGPNRLGKYGVGLKAASFGKSISTTVFSKMADGETCGIELFGDSGSRMYRKIDESKSGSGFSRSFTEPPTHGTIVRWEQLRGIGRFSDNSDQNKWLDRTTRKLATHLGLVFNQFLSDETRNLKIDITVVDAQGGKGVTIPVNPVEPIPTALASQRHVFSLTAELEGVQVPVTVYVAPKGTRNEELQNATDFENGMGLYVVRNKRLIRLGGWDGLISLGSRKLQLARVVVEIPQVLEKLKHLEVKHDKSGCQFSDLLRDAIIDAKPVNGSKNLDSLLKQAESETQIRTAKELLPPAMVLMQGPIAAKLEESIRKHCSITGTPVQVRFQPFEQDSIEVFHLDLGSRVLALNEEFKSLEATQIELILTCISVGLRSYLTKTTLNPQDKEDLKGWNALLWSALKGNDA